MFAKSVDDDDVVVVGSGAAGLTAALTAAVGGATVTVLEGSDRWGGATAVSGGQVWVPGNDHLGAEDSPTDALRYLVDRTAGRDHALLAAFADAAPRAVRFLEAHSPLDFQPVTVPDSFPDAPGGRAGGRNLEPRPVRLADLGPADDLFWPPPLFPPLLTHAEIDRWDLLRGGSPPSDLMAERRGATEVTMGQALVAGLLHGCREAGVSLRRGVRVTGLAGDPSSGITGVRTEHGDQQARGGVVLATGGFEHDPRLRARLLPGHDWGVLGPPVTGRSAVELAGTVGAALAHIGECWTWPATQPVDAVWPDGTARPLMIIAERMLPHSLWVNARGRRFVNESSHNAALALTALDPGSGHAENQPAWAIADGAYRARYPFGGATPGQPLPDHVVVADSLRELAGRTGIDPDGLCSTVRHFNAGASHGHDPDFARGESAYDRYWGDPRAAHPNLGPLMRPPFVALPLAPGLIGTKGGPSTDAGARVLMWDGTPIPGLYAAGNAMAGAIGPSILSAGATIGSAVAWGWIAGSTIVWTGATTR